MEFTVTYSVTTTFRGAITVTAENEDDARKQIEKMTLAELEEGHEETDVWSTDAYKVKKDE